MNSEMKLKRQTRIRAIIDNGSWREMDQDVFVQSVGPRDAVIEWDGEEFVVEIREGNELGVYTEVNGLFSMEVA